MFSDGVEVGDGFFWTIRDVRITCSLNVDCLVGASVEDENQRGVTKFGGEWVVV